MMPIREPDYRRWCYRARDAWLVLIGHRLAITHHDAVKACMYEELAEVVAQRFRDTIRVRWGNE